MPAGMNSVRAFIAIDIPEEVRQSLSRVTGGLRAVAERGVKWVAPRNIHLTLKFLGEIPADDIPAIQDVMLACAGKVPQFSIQPLGLGAFPARGRPRVIWIGLQAPECLTALAGDLDQRLTQLGNAAERRPFSPHLTIGRVRADANPADLIPLEMALNARRSEEFDPFEVHVILLYQSILQPTGAVYTRLFAAPLTVYNTEE